MARLQSSSVVLNRDDLAQWSVIMNRARKLAGIAFSAALLIAAFTPAAPALAAAQTCGNSGAVTTLTGILGDGADYRIECPAGAWNGPLFLCSPG